MSDNARANFDDEQSFGADAPSSRAVVGVIGAGAMGAGIAQVAARHGHRVILADAQSAAIAKASYGHAKAMAREVERDRLTADEAADVLARITYVEGVGEALSAFAPCDVVIEAIVEKLDAKRALFGALELIVRDDAILASNTSSLSITAIASACKNSARVVGIHFFNPATYMPLVEIIPGLTTDPVVAVKARAMIDQWGKTTVVASDTPGFIVNRVARPFYSESIRIYEEGIADIATIDWALHEVAHFPMGPFALMDFIGNDINYAVTMSVFESMFYDVRFRPSNTQRRMVESGNLGMKTGRGYYDHSPDAVKPHPTIDHDLARQINTRVIAMLVNFAVEAVHMKVASPHDLEVAMKTGVNYPKGLLAWGDEIGARNILNTLDALHSEYGDERYRASVLLRRCVREGRALLS